jgi:3-oxoacyl-[acyl-carrier-protein] synthase III
MKYNNVFLNAIGYELPPVVITTQELEERLQPVYNALHIPQGQLQAMTGIVERRWWDADYPPSEGAVLAARKALGSSSVNAKDIDVLIYAGVCREQFEPATACRVADALGIGGGTTVYDISNACLGVLNGIVDVANRIELGQARAGLVVSCETARDITDRMIEHMLEDGSMEAFKLSLTTLTGGSGAVAVLVTDDSFGAPDGAPRRRLLGGATQSAPQFHGLCQWGMRGIQDLQARLPKAFTQFMSTDSTSVLKYGVDLGIRTWKAFQGRLDWVTDTVDKVICHQVGSGHRNAVLKALDIPVEKDYSTYEYLGNMGTVSVPLTAALAEERKFLQPGDRVGFLGIGSGLNCLMLGFEW